MRVQLVAADFIAIILLVGAFSLKGLGYNHVLNYVIIGVALAYGAIQLPRIPR